MLAIALFTLGSVLCAIRHARSRCSSLFRVLQGLGGGMLMPLGMTIMTRAAGPQRMGRLMAILGVPMLLGPIGGPILGGYLIEHALLALDLPHQPADRHDRLAYAAWALPKDRTPDRVLRLGRHAHDEPRSGALPLRHLLDPR
jgi:MFS family permease